MWCLLSCSSEGIFKRKAHGLLKTLFSKALKKSWKPKRQMVCNAKLKMLWKYKNINICDEMYLVELAFFCPPPIHCEEGTLAYSAISYTLASLVEQKRCHFDRLWQEHCPSLSLEKALVCVCVCACKVLSVLAGWTLAVLNCDTQSDPDTCCCFF